MDRQPNHEDAMLILRLFELRRDEKMREAREWFTRNFNATSLEEFQELCPMGSPTHTYVRMVTSYWDMVASFITNGVLHDELFFQSGRELLLVWERIRTVAPALRQAFQDPAMYGNLEAVGTAFGEWWQRHSPEAYAAFQARMRAMLSPRQDR